VGGNESDGDGDGVLMGEQRGGRGEGEGESDGETDREDKGPEFESKNENKEKGEGVKESGGEGEVEEEEKEEDETAEQKLQRELEEDYEDERVWGAQEKEGVVGMSVAEELERKKNRRGKNTEGFREGRRAVLYYMEWRRRGEGNLWRRALSMKEIEVEAGVCVIIMQGVEGDMQLWETGREGEWYRPVDPALREALDEFLASIPERDPGRKGE
jgi:hypothetical protein